VDQGQAFIAGYSDEEDRLIRDDLPLVVFGDHTRCVKYVDFPFIVGADGTKVLKPNAELFDPKFFYYALLSLNIPNRGYNRHFTLLKEKTLPRPERAEQRKIAAVLGLVQRAIEQQERLIALTTELKKALLHKLFTVGLRGEPQKQTEIGPVPESWEVVMLEDAAVAFDYGTSVKCEHGNAGVPVLRIPNVVRGSIDLSDLKHGQPKRSELEQVRLRDGDLLFVRTNGVLENAGRCALYRGELEGCYFASYLIRVRVDSTKVLPAFVNEYARSERGRSFLSGRAIRTADGKFNINSGTLKRVLLPLPGLDEQKEIVRQLDLVERKLKLHESKRSALSELFRTLLHQLMTAEFRVQDLNLPELKAAKRQ
jgi:type I restriction enzyme S subunit